MSPGHFYSVRFSEGAKAAFSIVIKNYKLIGNSYKTKFVFFLWVFSIVRLLNLVCVVRRTDLVNQSEQNKNYFTVQKIKVGGGAKALNR